MVRPRYVRKFADLATSVIRELELGTPVTELYPLLREAERYRRQELGELSWPGCDMRLEDGWFVVITAHPTLDDHRDATWPADRPVTDEENTELTRHLLRIFKAWLLVAEQQAASTKPKKGGRPKGRVRLSKHERDCIRMARDEKMPREIDAIIMQRENPLRGKKPWQYGVAERVIRAARDRAKNCGECKRAGCKKCHGLPPKKRQKTIS